MEDEEEREAKGDPRSKEDEAAAESCFLLLENPDDDDVTLGLKDVVEGILLEDIDVTWREEGRAKTDDLGEGDRNLCLFEGDKCPIVDLLFFPSPK
jgi:hypothetical protein